MLNRDGLGVVDRQKRKFLFVWLLELMACSMVASLVEEVVSVLVTGLVSKGMVLRDKLNSNKIGQLRFPSQSCFRLRYAFLFLKFMLNLQYVLDSFSLFRSLKF